MGSLESLVLWICLLFLSWNTTKDLGVSVYLAHRGTVDPSVSLVEVELIEVGGVFFLIKEFSTQVSVETLK